MNIATALFAVSALAVSFVAQAQTIKEEFTMREDAPPVGSSIRREILRGSGVPLDKEWHELTEGQQKTIRAEYENLPADEEPPYPKGGLRVLYKPIADAYQLVAHNIGDADILMVAFVGRDGKPEKLDVYKSSADKPFTSFVAGVLMKATYKPGRCKSSPCSMPFVVALKLNRK